MLFIDILEIFTGGLASGMVLFILSAGLTLVFGVLRIINFAHGAIYMLSAYFCYSIVFKLNQTPYSYWLALLIAPLLVAGIGAVIEIFIIRPVYKREHLIQLLVTYALVLVVVDATKFLWGPDPKMVILPEILSGQVSLSSASFSVYYLYLILSGFITMIALWIFLNKTRIGHIIRAGAFDPEMTEALGINLKVIYTLIFALGAWMAGLAGVLIAPITTVSQGMDTSMLIEAFAVVVIGGMGSIGGAFIAAILIGLMNAFGLLWIPGIAIAFAFIVMAIVLIIRPWGLFGRPIK